MKNKSLIVILIILFILSTTQAYSQEADVNSPYIDQKEDKLIHEDEKKDKELVDDSKSKIEMSKYHKIVSKKISKNFKPPHFGTNKYASVRFIISRDGNVKELEIVESSGNEKFDGKCKEAVLDSEPFPEPPANDLVIDYAFSKKSPLNGFPIIIPIIIPH